ncbi:AzlD domain-containing protein [Corynebacterium macginleyi]|uniref:branched-chain amino acid transporter permease n=1 Tax=Corynebacterium macginleyi TaxID=38290 RepID=UPI00190BF943|nr:AzlD domain-containing protein [Corynebacterium macginleyi]QRJ57865.1 AzlD domain-containing protein [Corynebacterium macginleyi]
MPTGVSLGMVAAVLIPVGIVTVLLRELPFFAQKWMKDSEFFSLLGLMMPVGVMTILVVYAVAGQADGTGGLWPVLLGVLVTAGLHRWKRDSGLSVLGGTAFYMLLVNVVL